MDSYTAVDYHTAGEPFRIVTAPFELPGDTVAARLAKATNDPQAQLLRRILCHEPRGHADMYGGFVVPADDEDAHFGVLFWHKDGFATACGHGTIALGTWAVESGLVTADPDGVTEVVIDVPSGRVKALVRCAEGKVVNVDFVNVPSYAVALDVAIETSVGPLSVDVGYGGAIYGHVKAADLGLSVTPSNLNRLIELGREIKAILNDSPYSKHEDDKLSGIYGTIFFEEQEGNAQALSQKSVTIFADGQVDRSPCGSGTASRVAVLSARGRLEGGRALHNTSIVGATFIGKVSERSQTGGSEQVIPTVTGTSYITGRHEFILDERDELGAGFVLR
ncbi:proline racemase family protein [Arthrobacter sp. efr-133-TYG-118]|uniref:proline racemase family protein n=1 Tax=Arthrobacter sp. efr-133-TYG-118 TaxID=3040279 RepID=UPI00254E07DE|nr:proline racemase family protein [Arthrobacter sp. efr-133-TYG-118]